MTPDIRPFLQHAINLHPQRWAENTYESCEFILRLTLAFAGAEWQHVGKTAEGDGWSVQPPGFMPFSISLTRPDGQQQTVRIVGTSHDAAWHGPSGRQVKVIVNSAANSDPRPEIHGPARIGGEIIDPANYRWHNPPVPQFGDGQSDPVPVPPPPTLILFPPQNESFEFGVALNTKYQTDRHAPLIGKDSSGAEVYVDLKGMAVWIQDYLRLRVSGQSHSAAQAAVFATIDKIP